MNGIPDHFNTLLQSRTDVYKRQLFPDNYHAEVYVNIILFSADGVDMPDALAGLAASAALAVSDIPFNGPISEVRVARIDGKFVINPTFDQLEPVSYTHLDVYKRQDVCRPGERTASGIEPESNFA